MRIVISTDTVADTVTDNVIQVKDGSIIEFNTYFDSTNPSPWKRGPSAQNISYIFFLHYRKTLRFILKNIHKPILAYLILKKLINLFNYIIQNDLY